MVIDYYKNENDQNMLLNLYKEKWNSGLKNLKLSERESKDDSSLENLKRLSEGYNEWIKKEN